MYYYLIAQMNEDGSYNIDFALRHTIDPYEQEKKKALFAIIYEKCKAEGKIQ